MERFAETFWWSIVTLAAVIIGTLWYLYLEKSSLSAAEVVFWTVLQVIVSALLLHGYGARRRSS